MRRLLLLLPPLALLASIDAGRQAPPPRYAAEDPAAALRALPGRNEGRFGREGDALNLLFWGDEAGVSAALEAGGWRRVPRSVAASVAGGLEDLWLGRTLTQFPPMNDYSFMGRRQDMNWALVVSPIESRHHFRLWRTGIVDTRGRELWWGSGDFDLSVRWIDLSHRPDPEMDHERDFVAASLKNVDRVSVDWVALGQIPREGRNDKGYPFRNDGRALVVRID